MMKPEIKAEWVSALRSGEFPQGKMVLRRKDDTYCCLGVLCELAVRAGVIEAPTHDDWHYTYDGDATVCLPEPVERWAGIVDDHPGDDGDVISNLIGYNDGGKDFAYIADVIEARL